MSVPVFILFTVEFKPNSLKLYIGIVAINFGDIQVGCCTFSLTFYINFCCPLNSFIFSLRFYGIPFPTTIASYVMVTAVESGTV